MYINLQTERLIIRPIELTDAEFIFRLVNSESWLRFIGDRNVMDEADGKMYIQKILDEKNTYYNVFELKEARKPIGIVTFLKRDSEKYPDIGFALLPEFEKNGYTIEACKNYLQQVLDSRRYDNIIAITLPDNQKSISLLTKLGLKYVGDFVKEHEILSYFSLKSLNETGI
jgi:RimJ/RimL family protein N-acetyltransferase